MPMYWDTQGRRIVEEQVLLAEYRRRLGRDPVHQQRIRNATGDTPPDELLDSLSVSPPTLSLE